MLRNLSDSLSPACRRVVDRIDEEVGGFYSNNLYDECPHTGPFLARVHGGAPPTTCGGGAPGASSPCPLNSLLDWLTLPQVKASLGLPEAANFFDGDNGDGFNYKTCYGPPLTCDLLPVYEKAVRRGLRVLSINGGSDPTDRSGPNQDDFVNWAAEKGLRQTQQWRPWTVDGRAHVGGHVMEWEDGGFTWARVLGAGHFVPYYKPLAALTLISHFVSATELPRYVPLPASVRAARIR